MLRESIAATAAVLVLATAPARADWPVFDASNYAENILQAARALEQIENQVRSLQNEATMLQNMARNLESLDVSALPSMLSDLERIGGLMDEARGLAFRVESVEALFDEIYPGRYGTDATGERFAADARRQWQEAMDGFRQAMTVQARVVETVRGDAGSLSDLVNASQGAAGALEAQQAANQLLALSVKQQLQIQDLLAAQFRADAAEAARRAQAQEQARAAFARFLGSPTAYTAP
ncbi:P-type conjugative transfer protein TrbJ [Inquilinus sp. Marseille-Q2685]|uniref:P-type conjugative transfer protein TrbJ n=1 Tax=Inquilinus sp. Marseille-Q2685 TaxID=2866581 RepID=UPI001CE451B5|nr:P-type conjugative transfer protein TrbJ [Inquilinus sp. Marseille-Q2685]